MTGTRYIKYLNVNLVTLWDGDAGSQPWSNEIPDLNLDINFDPSACALSRLSYNKSHIIGSSHIRRCVFIGVIFKKNK